MRETQIPEPTETLGRGTREKVVSSLDSSTLQRSGIAAIGISRAQQGFEFCRPDPVWDAFVVTLEGYGEVWVNERWMPLEVNSVYVMPASLAHAYRCASRQGWKIVWAHFEERALTGPVQVRAAGFDPAVYANVVEELRKELRGPNDPSAIMHWSSLASTLARRLVLTAPEPVDDRLNELWEKVATEPELRWTVARLAAEAGIGEERLRQLTQKHHGTSPLRHVCEIRMERAAYLLKTTHWTLDRVSEAVGYASPYALSVAFKRVTGLAPLTFRSGGNAPHTILEEISR